MTVASKAVEVLATHVLRKRSDFYRRALTEETLPLETAPPKVRL